jgi:hypothetical protein
MVPDRRRALLTAALGSQLVRVPEPLPPALMSLRGWLGSWTGIGHIATGMARQGYDLELSRHNGQGWTASFWTSDVVHWSPRGVGGAAGYTSEPTPWRAVERAAWQALTTKA